MKASYKKNYTALALIITSLIFLSYACAYFETKRVSYTNESSGIVLIHHNSEYDIEMSGVESYVKVLSNL